MTQRRHFERRCGLCGRFIDADWWALWNCFATETVAFCSQHPYPVEHRERQQWLNQEAS